MLSKEQLDQIRMLVANQNSPFAQVMFIPELIEHIDSMEQRIRELVAIAERLPDHPQKASEP